MTVVLDSWAVLRWLEGVEPAAGRVQTALEDGAVMSWINVGEVFYVVWRAAGDATARQTVDDVAALVDFAAATSERVLEAAKLKAQFPMALGDAFAAATAIAHHARLLTGDPELLQIDAPWEAEDLR